MLHELHDRERLRALYERDPLVTVRARSILFGLRLPDVRILVDDPDRPRGALLTHDGLLWDAYSPDPQVAREMLEQLPPRERTVFFGLAGDLLEHARRSFEVLDDIPATLYALASPADFRPAALPPRPPAPLEPRHAAAVCEVWTVHDFDSQAARLAYVRSCIERGPSAAVLIEGRPVSFVLTHADGSMGILHTAPVIRRCGFGRIVLAALVRRLLDRGALVFAYAAVGNVASAAILQATGLRAVQEGAVLTVGRRRDGGAPRPAAE